MAELYEHPNLSPIAALLHHKIDASGKTQRELAKLMGYENANILSMLKHGETKVPLDKVPIIAKVLDIDPAHLFRLALLQYWPEWLSVVTTIFGGVVTRNETELLRAVRAATQDRDPAFDPAQIEAAILALTQGAPQAQR